MAKEMSQEELDRVERAELSRKQHGRRLLKAIEAGYTMTGARLSNPADGHASGVVVTFDSAESAQLVGLIKKLLEARG